jgi:hypothetical protein
MVWGFRRVRLDELVRLPLKFWRDTRAMYVAYCSAPQAECRELDQLTERYTAGQDIGRKQ